MLLLCWYVLLFGLFDLMMNHQIKSAIKPKGKSLLWSLFFVFQVVLFYLRFLVVSNPTSTYINQVIIEFGYLFQLTILSAAVLCSLFTSSFSQTRGMISSSQVRFYDKKKHRFGAWPEIIGAYIYCHYRAVKAFLTGPDGPDFLFSLFMTLLGLYIMYKSW